jgi:hypothetical protein
LKRKTRIKLKIEKYKCNDQVFVEGILEDCGDAVVVVMAMDSKKTTEKPAEK